MKKKEMDILEDPQFDRPLSKEAAKSKYEHSTFKNEVDHPVQMENIVEARIKRAIADGLFENLPGKGQPINLNDYNALPEHLRMGYQMLKNSGYLPEEVRLKKEMELIKEEIRKCDSDSEKKKLMKKLSETSQQFHFHMEYNKKFMKSLF